MIDSSKYAYSVGRVRVSENYMLDNLSFLRLLDAKDLKDAKRLLVENRYKDFDNYTDMLDNQLLELYSYLRSILPDLKVFDAFFFKYDLHNIKVLLKSEFLEKAHDAFLSNLGVLSIDDMKNALKERDFSKLPPLIQEAVRESIEAFSKSEDPQLIDLIMDKAYYEYFNNILNKSGDKFLKDFARLQTDLLNIKAFIRIKRIFKDYSFINKTLIEGGSIKIDEYREFFLEDLESFFTYIKKTEYEKILEGKDIEKNCDDFMTSFLRSNKYDPIGIAAIVGYLMGKETEIKNARIILMGKANKIDKETTRERLRLTYV